MAEAATHALIFPIPLQGHISPTLRLAELLSLKGLFVTFVTTDHAYHRLRRFGDVDGLLSRRRSLRIRSIPDGLEADHPRAPGQFREILQSLRTRCREAYRDLLVSLNQDPDGAGGGPPPVTCAIVDGFLPFLAEVAGEVGIPAIACRTDGPSSFWALFCVPKLIEEGEVPLPEGCNMDELVRGVPGMESFLRLRDLPSPCRVKDVNDPILLKTILPTLWTPGASGLIFNTVEALSPAVLSHIQSHCPLTYTVGPIHNLLKTLDAEKNGADSGTTGAPTPPPHASSPGMWQEDRACLGWLDAQPSKSVVYVSFGSLTVLSRSQLLEFWYGLVNSGHRFLWVIRADLLDETGGGAGDVPPEVKEGAEGKGCVVGWAPQPEVLAHPAVGAFLTHSGWNSTLEGIAAGVPMICWPFFYDQMVNSRYVSEVWRVGVDMKDTCDRGIVERAVREVMEGERAEELRRNVAGWAELVRGCVAEGGSSRVSLEKLVQDIRSMRLKA